MKTSRFNSFFKKIASDITAANKKKRLDLAINVADINFDDDLVTLYGKLDKIASEITTSESASSS